MSVRTLIYTMVVTLAVAGVAVVSTGLYRNGSLAVSGWIDAVLPGHLSDRHAFLSNRCEACHTPTKGVEAAVCIACHTTAAADLAKQSTAFHATSKECRGCHLEHAGGVRPTKMDHSVLIRIGAFSRNAEASAQAITEQMVMDLKNVVGFSRSGEAEKASLGCVACHSNREPHRGLFGRECVDCHGVDSWKIAQFMHPSPSSRECAQCHQAPPSHYMEHFVMMDQMITGKDKAAVNQCHLCHRTDSFNDIKDVGWYKHH